MEEGRVQEQLRPGCGLRMISRPLAVDDFRLVTLLESNFTFTCVNFRLAGPGPCPEWIDRAGGLRQHAARPHVRGLGQ